MTAVDFSSDLWLMCVFKTQGLTFVLWTIKQHSYGNVYVWYMYEMHLPITWKALYWASIP